MMRVPAFIALTASILPILTLGQTDQGGTEAAKLALVEKLYESAGNTFRKTLAGTGLSEDEIEATLFQAIDEYAACAVLAAQEQAREQGLPEDVVLKGLGEGTRGKEEAEILLQLDMEAMKAKRAPCEKQFNDALGADRR